MRTVGTDGYLFPILRPGMTEQDKINAIRQTVKAVNNYLRQAAGQAGINEKVTSYVARHSWATISKNTGVSTEFISEQLGHSNVNVTSGYLKSFEKSERKKQAAELERFIYQQYTG